MFVVWEVEEGQDSARRRPARILLVTPEPRGQRAHQRQHVALPPQATALTCRGGTKRGRFHGQFPWTQPRSGRDPFHPLHWPELGAVAPPGHREGTATDGVASQLVSILSILQVSSVY